MTLKLHAPAIILLAQKYASSPPKQLSAIIHKPYAFYSLFRNHGGPPCHLVLSFLDLVYLGEALRIANWFELSYPGFYHQPLTRLGIFSTFT